MGFLTTPGSSLHTREVAGSKPAAPIGEETGALVPRLGLAADNGGIGIFGKYVEVSLVGATGTGVAVTVDRRVGHQVPGKELIVHPLEGVGSG